MLMLLVLYFYHMLLTYNEHLLYNLSLCNMMAQKYLMLVISYQLLNIVKLVLFRHSKNDLVIAQ